MTKKFIIKEKTTKAKASDNKNYTIKIAKAETEAKENWVDGDKITLSGKATITEQKDGKDVESTTQKDKEVKLIYKKGTFFHYFKIEEVDGKTFADKEQKEVSAGGFGSYLWTFWAAMVIALVAIGGFIWWWISSSRKEEKEEEGCL